MRPETHMRWIYGKGRKRYVRHAPVQQVQHGKHYLRPAVHSCRFEHVCELGQLDQWLVPLGPLPAPLGLGHHDDEEVRLLGGREARLSFSQYHYFVEVKFMAKKKMAMKN